MAGQRTDAREPWRVQLHAPGHRRIPARLSFHLVDRPALHRGGRTGRLSHSAAHERGGAHLSFPLERTFLVRAGEIRSVAFFARTPPAAGGNGLLSLRGGAAKLHREPFCPAGTHDHDRRFPPSLSIPSSAGLCCRARPVDHAASEARHGDGHSPAAGISPVGSKQDSVHPIWRHDEGFRRLAISLAFLAPALNCQSRMKARNHWLLISLRIAALATALQALPPCIAQGAATYHDRADQALQSFLIKFWNGGQQYLRHRYPDNGSLTGYWTYANGWDALLDGVERTGGQQYSGLIESFYLGQNNHGWTVGYYDDECWMIMALLRAYDLSGDAKYLDRAKALYADVETGWDTSCCGANPGGLWWDKAHTQKATAANAGAALVGAGVSRSTGDVSYLGFAQQVYSWWRTNMVDPFTFQVADHIATDGTVVRWRFTYNEGLMIGASVELNEATGDASYLTTAHSIAGFMINNEIVPTGYGNVLYDCDNSSCGSDCHKLKGPAYSDLMRLYAKDTSKTQYCNVLKASADAIWNLARNSTTTFSVNWAGPLQSSVDEPQDSAACMALNRFAQQYGAYPGSGIPANQYEAENATLHHIG